jgi:predicted ATPase
MANYLVVGGLEGYKADYRACREQRAREKMLHLTNFKNFAEAHLDDTEPVTMLVGPHGAGKSNLIEATELLSFLAGGRPLHQVTDLGRQGPLEVRGGLDACASFGQTSFTLGHSLIVATAEGCSREVRPRRHF